jgi:hypothetical protein
VCTLVPRPRALGMALVGSLGRIRRVKKESEKPPATLHANTTLRAAYACACACASIDYYLKALRQHMPLIMRLFWQ